MSDLRNKFAKKLIDIYLLFLDIPQFTGCDFRTSFADILDMNDVKHTIYDYSYDGNVEITKVAIVYNKDIFRMNVNKRHKDNNVVWSVE